MSQAAPPAGIDSHPIGVVVNDDLVRSRLTVFFRLLLAIPHFIWLTIYAFVAAVVMVIAWFAALFTGRVPGGLHSFLAGYLRYSTRVGAYVLLLANPWPPFSNESAYPFDVLVAPAASQSRVTVFFRWFLAIPALFLTYVFRLVNEIVAFLGWFYALIFGRMHEGMANVSAWLFRYEVQTMAYLLLLTGRYPSLAGGPTV